VLLDTILDELGATELILCDFALREGLVLDYIQKNASHIRTVERYPDARRRSVMELAERCGYRAAHAQQVARLALAVFDATKGLHHAGAREREWLEYGALLHDVGNHISYERHHKHSYYLIKHGDLRGFDPNEIEIIALTARYHRQAEPKKSHEGFGQLSPGERKTVRLLGAIVRLAEGLDRSHAQVIRDVKVVETGDLLEMRLTPHGDTELELWAADRHASALAATLGRPIQFKVMAAPPAPKDTNAHVDHARHSTQLPRQAVRRRGHRRVRQDDAARPARQVAHGQRPSSVRH
jgi:exopolyphosphatase/guanosine-5'-triphosphate,3'-diphosphate pyrophosphatase